MRYYEAEPRPRRAGAGVVIAIGIGIIAISALVAFLWNPDDDDSGATSSSDSVAALDTPTSLSTVSTAVPVTATVVLTTAVPETTTAVSLVEDCAEYVPTAIYFGNAEMQEFWDAAGATPEGLRAACEGLAVSDPARLLEMSDAFRALQDLAATTTVG